MSPAAFLKLLVVLSTLILWRLKHSDHPLARRLAGDASASANLAAPSPAQNRAKARRLLALAFASGLTAWALFSLARRFASHTEIAVPALMAAGLLAIAAPLVLANSAVYAFVARKPRNSKVPPSTQPKLPAPLRPR